MISLPEELLTEVLHYLSPRDAYNIMMCSKQYFRLCDTDRVWRGFLNNEELMHYTSVEKNAKHLLEIRCDDRNIYS